MAFLAKIGVILFLAALTSSELTGDAQGHCTLSDIKVTQEKTGKLVQGQPEYWVSIENLCSCPQDNVQLHCNLLPSVEPVDSRKIKVEDELCKVASTLFKGSPVTFTYAWKTPQDFTVVSTEPECDEHDAIQG